MNLQELPDSGNSVEPANENSLVLDWSTVYGKDAANTAGLTWAYYGTPTDGVQVGKWGGNSVAAGTFTLTDDATDYIVVQRSNGAISCSASSTNWDNTTDYARVYKVTTAGGAVTAVEDHRAGPHGVLSGNNGSAVFTVVDGTGSPGINLPNIDTLEFMGAVEVHDMGSGRALLNVTGGAPGGSAFVQSVHASTASMTTTSSAIPNDDSIPQNTEGTELLTQAITPTDAANILQIDVIVHGALSATGGFVVALFQDTTANALNATLHNTTNSFAQEAVLRHRMVAGTTSATTFKVRVGPGSGTLTINGIGGARFMGGVMTSSITITEIAP